MSVPPWMMPSDPSQPDGPDDWFPHVVDQRPQPDGTVLVTVALPGLTRATVRVPQASWLEGEHLRAFPSLASLVQPPQQQQGDGLADDVTDDES